MGICAEGGQAADICADARVDIRVDVRAGIRKRILRCAELEACGYPRGGRTSCRYLRRYLPRCPRGYPQGTGLQMPLEGSANTCAGGSSLLGTLADGRTASDGHAQSAQITTSAHVSGTPRTPAASFLPSKDAATPGFHQMPCQELRVPWQVP